MQVDLTVDEIKTLLDILNYSLVSCSVENVGEQVDITAESVQTLVAKLQKTLDAGKP